MSWTNDMVDRLTELWLSGLTTTEIAKELGVSKNSIVGKVHRLNLSARPSPIKKKEDEVHAKKRTKVLPKPKQLQKKISFNKKDEHKISALDPDKTETETALKTKKSVVKKDGCVKLADLDSHSCRWPIGDPKDDNFCFCGKKVRAGQTYCDEHAAIAYVKPVKK